MNQISIIQPDDWHVHLRDNEALAGTVAATAAQFARAIVMPNLKPPVTDIKAATEYRQRILSAVPKGVDFEPLMTLYLTDSTPVSLPAQAKDSGFIKAAKYYPAGATTNSDNGVTNIENVYPVLEAMAEAGLPLLMHGEVTNADIDIFDREKVFIDTILLPLTQRFPKLRIVLEHITTKYAAQFVTEADHPIAATITAHHLLYNRSDMLAGGIRPHLYCLPILKRNTHQQALIEAATSGNPRFFLGTDSAPHAQELKEHACGCAGSYTAHAAIELYAQVFESVGALDKLEGFASLHGPAFYGLEVNTKKITLSKTPWTVPSTYPIGNAPVVPLCAGEDLQWKFEGVDA
ncbi:MAG: dihydroorotase [Pseudohongiellaceae bacterium]|nr:dihydroorotase [Pseudohongiellaceae bacterium]